MSPPLEGRAGSARAIVFALLLSLAAAVPVAAQSTTWTGAVSSTWGDANNWSNGVPNPSTDAVIAATANVPTTAGATASCRDLFVPAGTTLDVPAGSPVDIHRSSAVNGTVTGGGTLRFVGVSGTVSGSTLPDVEVANGNYTMSQATILGDLTQSAGSTSLRLIGVVQGNATFLGGTITFFDGLRVLDVAGDVTIQTSSPATAIPGRIEVAGDFTANANFQPASGRIVFDGAPPQTVTMPNATFHDLEIAAGSAITIAQPLTMNDELDCAGDLTVSGGSVDCGALLRIVSSGRLTLQGASILRARAALTVNGVLDGASTVLDVDGQARFAPGSNTTLGSGTHLFSNRVEFLDALTIPASALIALDGPTGALQHGAAANPLPNVEIRAGDHAIVNGTRISGRLDQLPGAGRVDFGLTNVGGDAVLAGREITVGSLIALDVNGDLTITTSSPTTNVPGTIRVAGDWTSNANWQPASGQVVFDGSAPQNVTMPSFAWHSLSIDTGASVSIAQPVAVAEDLEVLGTLNVQSGDVQVGDLFRIQGSGSVTMAAAAPLRVIGSLVNIGTLSAASATFDIDGLCRWEGSSTTTIGVGPHRFSGSVQVFGALTAPATTVFEFDGTGSISELSARNLPNITILSGAGAYSVGNASVISGDLTHQAGAGGLTLGIGVAVRGNLLSQGQSLTTGTALTLDLDGDVTIQTASTSLLRGRVTVAGDLTADASLDATGSNLVFDGANPQTVTVNSLSVQSLQVGGSTTLTLNVVDLTVANDLTVVGAFTTPSGSLTVGRDLIVQAGGALTVDPGAHTVARNLRNFGAPVAGTGTITLTGTGDLRGSASFGNLIVDTAGTRTTFGNVTIGGEMTLADGTLTISGINTLTVQGAATMTGGTLGAANASSVLDLDGGAVFSGTAAGSIQPIIRCAGDWASNSSFSPTSGQVVLDGAATTRLEGLAPGFDPTFFDLRIVNGTREITNDLSLDSPGLTVGSGGGIVVTRRRSVRFRCVGVTIDGRFEVRPGARVSGDSNTNYHVRGSGTLALDGEPGSFARFDGHSGGAWSMLVEGTLDASFFEFRDVGPNGVQITSGAVIQALHDGTFADPSAQAGSVLLDLSRAAAIDLDDIAFVDTAGVGTFNVRSSTLAPIRFQNWSGAFGGSQFEDDPNGVIDWLSSGRTEIDDFEANGAIGRIELSFETTREIDARFFRISRATVPEGPFTELPGSPLTAVGSPGTGAAYSLTDSGVTFPNRYYYRLEEERLNGVLRLLATDFARPLPMQLTGNGFFVGPGGFTDIGAALAAATPGANILVEPGTYPGFTVAASARIAPLGAGRIQVSGPIAVRNIPAGTGDVLLQGMDLSGSPLPLEVSGCGDVVVLDDLTVPAQPGGTGVRVTSSPRVAVQECRLTLGAASLLVDTASTVHIFGGTVDVLDARTASTVVYAGVTPGSVLSDPTSTVNALLGSSPRMEFRSGWPASKVATIGVTGDVGDVYAILVSPAKGYTSLPFLGFLEMVLLLDQSLLLTVDQGLITTGSATASLLVPDNPGDWGRSVPLQVAVLRPALGKLRFGNVRDAVFLP